VRVSAQERLKLSIRSETEIMRYARQDPDTGHRPHALWHKHVHGVALDPMQVLKMMEMDQDRNTIDYSCRRVGKTTVKELYNLEQLATKPHHECGIVAPRERQSINSLLYHIEAIRRSEILKAFIAYRGGREQLSDTKYEFANRSRASSYGIMAQIDGDSLAIASLEEVDDMPADRLFSRFLPMLGAVRRLGTNIKILPEIRISGVWKGADTLERLRASGNYHTLPVVDVYLGIALGVVTDAWRREQMSQMSNEEYIRQILCVNIAARNLIWERHIRRAMAVGLQASLEAAEPVPGRQYRRRGLIGFGYDHTGHGESGTASKSAIVVTETVGNYVTFPYARTWPAGTDDKVLEGDLYGLWDYFRPDVAIGDAYGVGMLTGLNDRLFRQGLTTVDRHTIGDGRSAASTWPEWAFSPLRFEGMTKHSMATVLRNVFHNGRAALPYLEDAFPEIRDGAIAMPKPLAALAGLTSDFALLVRQLANMRAEKNASGSYDSYRQVDAKIGDDLFDAAMASVWGIATRGADLVPTATVERVQSRNQLLGHAA